MTVPLVVVVTFVAPDDEAVIVPDVVPDGAEAVSLTNNVLLTVPLVTSNTKLVAYVPLIVLAISKFEGAVMVTLAVNPAASTPNETEEEATPKHDIKEAEGFVSNKVENGSNVYGVTVVFQIAPTPLVPNK